MPSLGMYGPYMLDHVTIDTKVTRISPGNYALGGRNEHGTFLVDYVGRSDDNINGCLKDWVGKTRELLFKFSYATSPKEAFEKECNIFHDFKPPSNTSHPARPRNTNWKCPRCPLFD